MEGHKESRAISDNIDGGECRDELNSLHGETLKKRTYSRRNVNQVEELEAFFKENPHPDPQARLELGRKLNMNSNQVKFWFQRRRSQVKMKSKCEENETLKKENYVLYIQNISMKEAMRDPICKRCGYGAIIPDINVDEHQTRIENNRLKHEIKRIRGMEKKLMGPSAASLQGSMSFMKAQSDFQNDLPVINTTSLVNEDGTYNKSKLMNLAFYAMNELLKLAKMDEPFWVRSLNGGGETLNLEEYAKSFTRFNGMKPSHFTTEATRASGILIINSQTLVEILMDKSQWVDIFSCIVGKTSTFDVISGGIGGNRSGTLLLIQTEFQIISDLVPVREIKFLRFCQQLPDGIWVIVDVSVDTIQGSRQCKIGNCRRLPSGCIVKEMPNGYSMVTWIEHMEYDENFVHYLYRPLVRSGLGFGAQRWLTNLQRQSEFLLVMMSSVNATSGHAVCPSHKKGIGMLAKRMTRNFCAGVSATIHKWEIIHLENEDVKLMMRKNIDDPGEPIGVVLSATKTIRMPVKPQCLFEFFMKEQLKSQQNVLLSSNPLHQMVYIFKDQNLDSGIPPLLANGDDTSANQNNMFFLQDTHADVTGSLFVYAKIDSLSLNMVMNGGDSSCVALLPSGIAIVPDCFSGDNNNCNGASGKKGNDNSCSGSLVTIGYQVLLSNSPDAKFCMESANTVKAHVSRAIHYLKTALNCN